MSEMVNKVSRLLEKVNLVTNIIFYRLVKPMESMLDRTDSSEL